MRPRYLPVAIVLAALLPAAPSALGDAVPIQCPADDGRERLTTDGFKLQFESPYWKTYEAVAALDHTKPVRAQRDAKFQFTADFTPYTSANVKFTLNWTESADHDLVVLGAEGEELGVANARTVFDGPEVIEIELPHCQPFEIIARSGPGHPGSMMSLDVQVTPGPTTLACAENDPAPGCAGKVAGEAPSRVPDERTRLYLGGDRPGQVAMLGHYPYATAGQGNPPMDGLLTAQRPTGGVPNTFTHPPTGNTNQNKNPFQAHFTLPFTEPGSVVGDVHALLWVSSETLKNDGVLHVDLFVDGTGPLVQTRQARIDVPGAKVNSHPTPIRVTFPNVQIPVETDFTIQVSADGVVQSTGPTIGRPGDAQWTLWYDSVQFPSRVTLKTPA